MNRLGFTAEVSIYKSSRRYSGSVHLYSGDRSQIVPARLFFPWIGYWLFSGTLARECVEQELQGKAASLCQSLAVQVAQKAGGVDCSAFCTAPPADQIKYDSDCNVTSSPCDCEVTCR